MQQETAQKFRKYLFEDKEIERAGNYYYRIKQIDLDGEYDYSATVFVSVQKGENTISLFPNPSVGISKLRLDMVSGDDVLVTIFDVDGKLIKSLSITSNNSSRIDEDVIIDELPAGVYMINISQNEFKEVKKLIVIR